MASSGDCSKDGCSYSFLQYEPSLAGNVALLALFATLIPAAFFLGIRYQSSIFSTTIITGLFLEIIGYIGRILLARNDNGLRADYALSELGTILGPTVISLAIFRLMPPIVAAYGEHYRAWRPTWHNIVFYVFTTACLVLQVVGGVLSTAATNDALNNIGVRLLVAGLAVHVASLFVFALLGIRFALAVRQRKGGWDSSSVVACNSARFKAFLSGLTIAIFLLIIRTVFRMVVIAEGQSSDIARNEVLFLVLDGALVLVAVTLLLALFPGAMLGPSWSDSTIHHRRMTSKAMNRPAPIQLEPAAYIPYHNRVSLKSGTTNSPKTYSPKTSPRTYSPRTSPRQYSPNYRPSPRKSTVPPPSQRNMVDREQLW